MQKDQGWSASGRGSVLPPQPPPWLRVFPPLHRRGGCPRSWLRPRLGAGSWWWGWAASAASSSETSCSPASPTLTWLIWILTIDVSNLNRQVLFPKKHVGRSKAQVAKESVLQFYPKVSVRAYHDSIMKCALIIMSQDCICCEFLIKPSKVYFY